MIKLCMPFILMIIYLNYCSAGFPFRRIPEQQPHYNEVFYIPAITDDPDISPNGIFLRIYEDHFGSRYQITNKYGTSRTMPLQQVPSGYIDENIIPHSGIKNLPFNRNLRKPNSVHRFRPKRGRRVLKIIHDNSLSDLGDLIINNEILRYFSLANFGLLED